MISVRATRVLKIILLALILILVRVWYLAVIQHDEQVVQAHKPQRRVVVQPVERATIYDRFGQPLAVNKIQYNAALCYANIRQIPSVEWKSNKEGRVVRIQARSEYITCLAALLAKELNMDPVQIEDTIHGKASLFPHTPFVIKEDISEEQYFRLKMLEKDWLGIDMQRGSRRHYPQEKICCDVVGFLGAISQKKYLDIAEEIRELESYIAAREQGEYPFLPRGFSSPLEVRSRLTELHEKAYMINDLVGKAGIEATYEEELRGSHGRRTYEVDVKGNFLRELPGSKKPISGKKVILSISSELQGYAEDLLAGNEGVQNDSVKLDERWMKGGAVVAMIPKTGEVVAMASYPRFDPNDFIPARDPEIKKEKTAAVQKWLEQLNYIGDIWDGKQNLERELFSMLKKKYEKESIPLTWNRFLETTLPAGTIRNAMHRIVDLNDAVSVQQQGIHHAYLRTIFLDDDRLLLVDLCRLAADKDSFSPILLNAVGKQKISEYNELRQEVMRLQSKLKEEIQELYHDFDFTEWRKISFKEYLKKRRKEEKEQKKYARPYTDYLDKAEKKLFQAFWDAYRYVFLYVAITGKSPVSLTVHPHLQPYFAHLKTKRLSPSNILQQTVASLGPELGLPYLQTMRQFHELSRPLLGHYKRLRNTDGVQLGKHLAAAFYPLGGYGFARSQAFRQGSSLGSVFKLVTAYEALSERYKKRPRDLNPLTLIDDLKGDHKATSSNQVLGYTIDGHPILRSYKGGRLPRSSHSHIGRIDILGALEQSSNIYFSILAGEHLQNPENLAEAARLFSFGEKTGIDLPGEIRGNLPDDLKHNRTGLYSFAIGQHSLVATPLQTAVMFSTIANKGEVVQPKVAKALLGTEELFDEEDVFSLQKYAFKDQLALVGIHFPLFTTMQTTLQQNILEETATELKKIVPFPPEVYNMLTEGMRRVVQGSRGTAHPAVMRPFWGYKDYFDLHRNLIAKTGTAQIRYKQTLDYETLAEMRRHAWFGCIAYPDGILSNHPELVVVVYLRYGGAGREAGPIAAQVIKKWRELNRRG